MMRGKKQTVGMPVLCSSYRVLYRSRTDLEDFLSACIYKAVLILDVNRSKVSCGFAVKVRGYFKQIAEGLQVEINENRKTSKLHVE